MLTYKTNIVCQKYKFIYFTVFINYKNIKENNKLTNVKAGVSSW